MDADTQARVLKAAALIEAAKHQIKHIEQNVARWKEEIKELTGFDQPSGQKSFTAQSPLGSCTVVLKRPVNITVNADRWEQIRRGLPPKHPGREAFVRKYSLDKKLADELREKHPTAWAEVSGAVVTKPGKVSVDVAKLVANVAEARGAS